MAEFTGDCTLLSARWHKLQKVSRRERQIRHFGWVWWGWEYKMARSSQIRKRTVFENLNKTFIRLRRLRGWRRNYFRVGKTGGGKWSLIFQRLRPCTKWRKTIIINVIFITKYYVKKNTFCGRECARGKKGVPLLEWNFFGLDIDEIFEADWWETAPRLKPFG